MKIIPFGGALRAFRRSVHVNREHCHAVVLVPNSAVLNAVFSEAISTMGASSLGSAMVIDHTNKDLTFEPTGAWLRFGICNTVEDLQARLAGLNVTHAMFFGEPTPEVAEALGAYLHSPSVLPEYLRIDYCEL